MTTSCNFINKCVISFSLLKIYRNTKCFSYFCIIQLYLRSDLHATLSKMAKPEHVTECWLISQRNSAIKIPQKWLEWNCTKLQHPRSLLTALFTNMAQLYSPGYDLLHYHCGWFKPGQLQPSRWRCRLPSWHKDSFIGSPNTLSPND